MIITRSMLSLIGAASIDEYRASFIGGIHIPAPGFAVATDGHLLATLADSTCDPARMAEWPLDGGQELGDVNEPITIPIDACKAALGLMRAQGARFHLSEFRDRARLIETHAGIALAVLNKDMVYQTVPLKPCDGQFPNWQAVWDQQATADPGSGLGIAAGPLGQACKVIQAVFGQEPIRPVLWQFHGPTIAAEFQAYSHELTLRGLIMPCRIDDWKEMPASPIAPTFAPQTATVAA